MAESAHRPHNALPTTSWSLVLAAAHGADSRAQSALTALCQSYWYPLYAYLRRQGHSLEEAEDLTQGFFTRLIEKQFLQDVTPQRGKFRSFLLTALRHFASNERDYARAQRRGGGQPVFSLDFADGERRFLREPVVEMTPERIYERDWALALLDRVMRRLRHEWESSGRGDQFNRMKVLLTGDPAGYSYREAAATMGTTEGALKVAVHRLRKRYRAMLQEEIAATVDDPSEVAEEIRFLFDALSR
jgi:RNA polymerase sigma-70 factor (ECF subfamily)